MNPADDDLSIAVEALRELILAGEKYRQAVTTHLDLDISQTQALSYLYSCGDMGQGELGVMLGVNTSTMTALVDRLERDGIATRHPHPTDRRRSVVRLAKGGRRALRTSRRWFIRAFDHVEPAALPALSVALIAIAADLRANSVEMAAKKVTPH